MKVVRAENAGACYGVQRALSMAHEAIEGRNAVFTLGPLIHNPRVVAELEQKGIHSVETLAAVPENDTVIVRSHGISPFVFDELQERGGEIIDATCPFVKRAQKAAEELAHAGCHVLVIGEEGHPEVVALCDYVSYVGGVYTVVNNVDDIPDVLPQNVGVVIQTTQIKRKLDDIEAVLRERGITPVVKNTICSSTEVRQHAARQLAEQVDAMVIIGGKNSSNTTRLFEICSQVCPRSLHIESEQELNPEFFYGCKVVGVTAGASTPDAHIADTIAVLEAF